MAGIISNVDKDVQELRKLKNAIEDVKKSLKGINIKVDIDIAEGLQVQLKSLTEQYHTLVSKIAEAEGKILLSAKRINDASEKIIQAQEMVSQVTDSPVQIGNTSAQANMAETASIQAQAKAYDDLRTEINDILGTRDANIKRMVDEMNAIRLINAEIKEINKLQEEYSSLSSAQQKRLEQLNNSLLTHKTVLSEVRQTLSNNAKLDNVATTSMEGLSQSLSRMRMAYRNLTEEERKSPFGKELLASINQADAKIKELDATIGNHQRNVGNYGKQWNGLNMAIQQVGRELPSLAYGPKVFFSAISNNLPILADEIKRARTEYDRLKKSGDSAIPVWKQVVSSLFSWQSALTVGITLLTLYGDKLVDWIVKAVKGKDRIEDIRKSMLELNEIEKDANSIMIRTRSEINNVISSLQSFNGTKEQEKRKIDELNSKYGSIFGVYNSLSQWYDILIHKGDDYINSLFAQAKAQAYIQKAIEADQKIRNIKAKGKDEYTPFLGVGGKVYQFFGGSNKNQFGSDPAQIAYNKAITDAENEKKEALENAKDLQKQYLAGIKKAGLFDYSTILDSNQANKLRSEQERLKAVQIKNAKDLVRRLEDLYIDVEQSRINAMDEGGKKTLEQMELNHEKELLAIDRERQEFIQAKKDSAKAEFDAEENVKAAKDPNYKKRTFDSTGIVLSDSENAFFDNKYKATLDKQAKERQAYYDSLKKSMNDYLAAYGTYIEKRNAIIAQGEEKKKGKNEWEQKNIDKEINQQLSALDEQAYKTTSAITQLFGDMKDKTLKDLQEINQRGEEALDFLKGGQWDAGKGAELGITEANFKEWSQDPEKIEAITKSLKDNKRAADDLRPAYDKVTDGVQKFFAAGSDPKKLTEALQDIQDGLNGVMQMADFLSDTLSGLGDAFGSDALKGISNGINTAMSALDAGMKGAQAGAMFGPIGAAAGAAIGVVSSLASSIAKIHDAKNEKRIQRLQEQIEVLEKTYDKLGDSIEKAYSKDASQLINQQNEMLEQQKVLIQNQIREEADKKDPDNGRIKEWKNQIEEINKLIEENKEKAVDAIFGEDLKSAIDNFASAYADAWTSGEDRAKSAKDTVRDMMRQMVTESIKSAIQSSEAMKRIRDKLKEFYADNVFSGWEQDYIYDMAESLQKDLDRQFGWADSLMKNETDDEREASQKGITTASQESVDENNGRLAVMQEHTFTINENISRTAAGIDTIVTHTANLSCLTSIDKTMQSILSMRDASLTHLSNIDSHTARLEVIESTLVSMKSGIDTLNTKGITLKR